MTEWHQTPASCPSAALQAANTRLLVLRAQKVSNQQTATDLATRPESSTPVHANGTDVQRICPSLSEALPHLPPHLGWQSASATSHLRRQRQAVPPNKPTGLPPVGRCTPNRLVTRQDTRTVEAVIPLQPSLALAMLRSGQTAAGRLWLLLRYLDENGRGWLELADVRDRLTKKDSPIRLCGPRQLRALLQQGNDLFWQRNKTRVWLCSIVKVAAGLGVGRLQGNAIALPLAILLEPIGLIRAHFYASFHSSRTSPSGKPAPISRVSLTAVSGVCRRSQHAYERRAGVVVRPNIAMGDALSQHTAQAAAWHHGRAAFVFTDKQGKQGKPGQQYLAWRLPNSYSGPHTRLGRGRQRQLNRQLVDLRHYGDVGNGYFGRACAEPVAVLSVGRLADVWQRRRYTTSGVLAARCLRRQPEAWVYWQGPAGRRASFWYMLSGGVGFGA